jgi:uncharacterized OB-fold protein
VSAARPTPVPDELSQPFWTGTAAGHLVLQRCDACRTFVHPPAPVCPACGDADAGLSFEPVAGRGAVRSWTVVRQPFLPGFDDLVPDVLVDVELDDAPDVRLIGRFVDGVDALPLPLGSPVTVVYEVLADGSAIPAFTRAEEEGA